MTSLPNSLRSGPDANGQGFFRAVGIAQWFLDRGSEQPLEAIGMTASVVVFVAAAIYKLASVVI